MEKKKFVDVDGADAVSKAVLALLNTFPGLNDGESVQFSTLSESGGIGFFPSAGSALLSNKEDITGRVHQVCLYPFDIIYRAAPKTEVQKLRIKDFLDALGKWLELQPVTLNGKSYKLLKYPDLLANFSVISDETDDALLSENICCLETETAPEQRQTVKRKVKSIARTSAAHLSAAYQDGVEDWLIAVTLQYENDFIK